MRGTPRLACLYLDLYAYLMKTVDAIKCDTDADCPSNTPGVPYTWMCYKNRCYNTKDDTPKESIPID
ncbi:hypothetical protein P8452_47945 [Trifolium repens]|nr:hypothetical protein P8452_47945 [Trifolium repens]